MKHDVLVLGACYGALFATRLLMAGHRVTLVCTRPTAQLINREGTVVRFPVRGADSLLEIRSAGLPGTLSAACPEEADALRYDLIVLAMQEAHYAAPGVRELMGRIARARKPCFAIMNMPPLPYLRRIPVLADERLEGCYADPAVWEEFDPKLFTLASPDPQAFRPSGQPKNVLQVGLATNFKAARFDMEGPTRMLQALQADIEQSRIIRRGESIEVPVKLRVHDSIFVPLAKWPMLMAGNYRCIRKSEMIAIRDAVHGDPAKSGEIYDWVAGLCRQLGASDADLVPFEKYARAAEGLGKPSSAARALFGGARHIERVDRLVACIARKRGLQADAVQNIVALVDEHLGRNRLAADRIVA